MNKHCPICGRPFSVIDLVLSEHDVGYQCRHCWNRVQPTGVGMPPRPKRQKERRIVIQHPGTRRAAKTRGKKP